MTKITLSCNFYPYLEEGQCALKNCSYRELQRIFSLQAVALSSEKYRSMTNLYSSAAIKLHFM